MNPGIKWIVQSTCQHGAPAILNQMDNPTILNQINEKSNPNGSSSNTRSHGKSNPAVLNQINTQINISQLILIKWKHGPKLFGVLGLESSFLIQKDCPMPKWFCPQVFQSQNLVFGRKSLPGLLSFYWDVNTTPLNHLLNWLTTPSWLLHFVSVPTSSYKKAFRRFLDKRAPWCPTWEQSKHPPPQKKNKKTCKRVCGNLDTQNVCGVHFSLQT